MTSRHDMRSVALSVALFCFTSALYRKKRSSERQATEEHTYGNEESSLPSIIEHFKELRLDPNTTVEEANKRRTVSYYEKSREAHAKELVPGTGSYRRLIRLRRAESEQNLSYYTEATQSHRTVVVMCDSATGGVLGEARQKILDPLQYSTDAATRGVYIPALNIIPERDMHVTVAVPWWWHTMGENNEQLSKDLASRFRQTLFLKLHHPFQIELQRIVLLGGSTLVALWRTVGERTTEDGFSIYDRHGKSADPFVRLREEIVRCFTTESPDGRRQPLTYKYVKSAKESNGVGRPRVPPTRRDSIASRSPGLGQGDGFIHTTLCRLPRGCLSQDDVDLDPIHRLCREASSTFSGHRMVVSKFRFLETTGAGGEVSNL